jgi:hypothetical protein
MGRKQKPKARKDAKATETKDDRRFLKFLAIGSVLTAFAFFTSLFTLIKVMRRSRKAREPSALTDDLLFRLSNVYTDSPSTLSMIESFTKNLSHPDVRADAINKYLAAKTGQALTVRASACANEQTRTIIAAAWRLLTRLLNESSDLKSCDISVGLTVLSKCGFDAAVFEAGFDYLDFFADEPCRNLTIERLLPFASNSPDLRVKEAVLRFLGRKSESDELCGLAEEIAAALDRWTGTTGAVLCELSRRVQCGVFSAMGDICGSADL